MKQIYPFFYCINTQEDCSEIIDIEQLSILDEQIGDMLDSAIVKAPDDIISSVTEQYA